MTYLETLELMRPSMLHEETPEEQRLLHFALIEKALSEVQPGENQTELVRAYQAVLRAR